MKLWQKCSFLVRISEIKGYYLVKKNLKIWNCNNFVGIRQNYLEFDRWGKWREICLVLALFLKILDFHWKNLPFLVFEILTTNVHFFQSWNIFRNSVFDQRSAFHVPTFVPNSAAQCRTPKKLWPFLEIFHILRKKKFCI